MSRKVSLDEKAVHQATAFLADDPDGLRAVLAAIDALSEHPYPDGAFPFGATGLHRLRVGRYRCSTPSPRTSSPSATSPAHRPTAEPSAPPSRLSWNQTWCELWLTRVVSSSYRSRARNHSRR